jgi:membrane-associated phospholipid phosphatase
MPPVDVARWTTTLTASYLAITAALIVILGNTVPGRVWLVAVHLTLSGALLILNRARRSAGILRVIRDWHPLMLFPLLYKEVEVLAAAIGDWRLSAAIPAWESALFAGQPSLYLSERLAFVPLSEYLHFCYLSYVIVIPSVTAYWYVSGRRAAFGELLLMLSTVLLGSYLFFILLPVDSPYYLSQRLGPPLSGHFFFDLVHQMSARGGARGGAFPSAHVSGAVVVSLVAWRHQRRLAYLLVPISGSMMIATVYGRFHYVLDTLAGAALAIVVVLGYRYIFGDGPGERQSACLAKASMDRSDASASITRSQTAASRSVYNPPNTANRRSRWIPRTLRHTLCWVSSTSMRPRTLADPCRQSHPRFGVKHNEPSSSTPARPARTSCWVRSRPCTTTTGRKQRGNSKLPSSARRPQPRLIGPVPAC